MYGQIGNLRWRLIVHERGMLAWTPRWRLAVFRSMKDDRWRRDIRFSRDINEARRELDPALEQLATLARHATTIYAAWRRLGECEDDGVRSEYCGDREDDLDTIIAAVAIGHHDAR